MTFLKIRKDGIKFVMNRKKIIFLLFTLILFIANIISFTSLLSKEKELSLHNNENLRVSYFKWATLELTNPFEVNESRFPHDSMISIKGRIYSKSDETNKSGIEVIIQVDSIDYPSYNDFTDLNGRFTINYVIDPNLDVYSPHEIKAIPINYVTNPPGGYIENPDFYTINVNTNSYFEITFDGDPATPKLTEEMFDITGFLRFYNGMGIPNKQVDYFWLDGATILDQGFFITDGTGALSGIQVPITSASDLTLKLNFSEPPFVNYSERFIYNIKIFPDITWDLNIAYTTTEGTIYILTGTLFSSTNPSLRISNREVEVYFNGTYVVSATTDINGFFYSEFPIPLGNGTASIQVQLVDFAGKDISSPLQYILVESAPPLLPGGGGLPPFLLFSLIFFPILAGIVAGLAVYGFKYYKKQEEESRVISLPLESKIKNLKILKDSGRLEESISY
ncbi:MAG: hypothetical protein ACFE9M_01620, partial [Promethearchaeota archaeon]